MLLISSKKLFPFSRYSKFCISDFPSLFHLDHYFRGWSKINLKAYDVVDCLNKNLIRFIWYLEKEKKYDIETLSTDKDHLYVKTLQKIWTPTKTILILVNNSKQPLEILLQIGYFDERILKEKLFPKSDAFKIRIKF